MKQPKNFDSNNISLLKNHNLIKNDNISYVYLHICFFKLYFLNLNLASHSYPPTHLYPYII